MMWRELGDDRSALRFTAGSVVALVLTLTAYARFLPMIEHRVGVVLNDPVLAAVPPSDVTLPIFIILYGSVFLAVTALMKDPLLLARAVRAYTALILLRMLCMWVVPLDPPVGMITLADPIVQVATGTSSALTRDLFFSGHTSILVLMALVLPHRWLRVVFALLSIAMGTLVLLQHVHYTIDVVVAPLAAVVAVAVTKRRDDRRVRP